MTVCITDPDVLRLVQQAPEVLDMLPRMCTDMIRHVLTMHLHVEARGERASTLSDRIGGLEASLHRVQQSLNAQLDTAVQRLQGSLDSASLSSLQTLQLHQQVLTDRVSDLSRQLQVPQDTLRGTVEAALTDKLHGVVSTLTEQVAAAVQDAQRQPAQGLEVHLQHLQKTLELATGLQDQTSNSIHQSIGSIKGTVDTIVTKLQQLDADRHRAKHNAAVKGRKAEDTLFPRLSHILQRSFCHVENTATNGKHQGDFVVSRPPFSDIIIDVKDYTHPVPATQTKKLLNDMKAAEKPCHGICVSLNNAGFTEYSSMSVSFEANFMLAVFVTCTAEDADHVLRDMVTFIHQFDAFWRQQRDENRTAGIVLTSDDTVKISNEVQNWMAKLSNIKDHAKAITDTVNKVCFDSLLAIMRGTMTAFASGPVPPAVGGVTTDVHQTTSVSAPAVQQGGLPQDVPGHLTRQKNPNDRRSAPMPCTFPGCTAVANGASALSRHVNKVHPA